jgi:hypothetical protein
MGAASFQATGFSIDATTLNVATQVIYSVGLLGIIHRTGIKKVGMPRDLVILGEN